MVRAGCVFVAGIHPSRTWTSGSFESVRWNACVHSLDLGLYSHPKEFLGNGVWTHVYSKGKIPSSGKFPQRRIEPATLWTGSPNTTNWAIAAPRPWFNSHFCHRSFCRSSHTTDLKTGTPVAILPGAWRYRINVGTGWPCVSIRWLSKTKFDLQLLSQCGRTYSWLSKSVPEIR